MTAQHVPHTPPMWRKVLSLPHTRPGWLAIGLSGTSWVLQATSTSVLHPVLESLSSVWLQSLVFSAAVLPGVAGTVVASIALLRSHERSALVWLAMVAGLPAFLGAGWIVLVMTASFPVVSRFLGVFICVLIVGVVAFWFRRQNSGKVTMSAHHTPQREAERSAVEEAQSRRREEEKQRWFNRLMVGLGVVLALILLPIMLFMLAELVDPLRQLLNGIF